MAGHLIRGHFSLRIFLILAVVITVAAMIFNVIFFKLQENQLKNEVVRHGITLTTLFADNVRLGVFAESLELLKFPADSLMQQVEILSVCIGNESGEILYFQTKTPVQKESREICSIARITDYVESSHWSEEEGIVFIEPVLSIVSDVPEEELFFQDSAAQSTVLHTGYVQVKISDTSLRQGMEAIVLQTATTGIGFLLLLLPLTFMVVNQATRPLQNLLLQIRKEFSFADPHDGDIELLSSTYFSMLIELEESFRKINELNEGLEQKVEQRTRELHLANEELTLALSDLQKAQMQLVQSEKMAGLGLLSTGLAHEINNSMTVIRGALLPLKKNVEDIVAGTGKKSPADQRQVVAMLMEHMQTGVSQITALIRDLMSFAQPGKGNRKLVDVNKELDICVALLATENGKQVNFIREFGSISPVLSHGSQLGQVFFNLLHNAMQAVESEGRICIRTNTHNKDVMVEIEDNGCGMEKETLEKAFDPFFTTKEVGQGTGLGLGICHSIVKQHHGTILLTSIKGEGCTATIVLPALVTEKEVIPEKIIG